MSDEDALLQAISDNPDDDGVRLVYADWLEEHGQPNRADFIRVQIALAGLPVGDTRRDELQAREWKLLEAHQEEWVGPVRRLVYCWMGPLRGFVEEVSLDARAFLEHAQTLFRLSPIRTAHLTGTGDHLLAVATVPQLARLSTLTLGSEAGCRVGDALATALAASPYLAGLRTLRLANGEVGDAGTRALATSPHLAGLVSLELRWNWVGNAGAEALAGSPTLAGLRHLGLWRNRIRLAGAQALAASTTLGQLARLDLAENRFRQTGRDVLRTRFGDRVILDARRLWRDEFGDEAVR